MQLFGFILFKFVRKSNFEKNVRVNGI